ncbi:uncharacterized protein LOC131060306 isoform X2 [Cryptomeria japonica]|uniref:uncharacterized protein LOC131060306 isoform X2 n=1 Tax=Cryptomeria japonica TaxID=3369 RepID=UPI0027D9F209|nr:uncharacterized protein LOC131060306 isoform X2 [Cryptomeria japonica]
MRIVCNAFFHRAILSLSLMEMMKARKSVAVDQSISTLDLCTFSVCAEKIRFLFRRLLVFIRFRLTRLFLFEMVHPALQGQFSTKGLVQAGCSNCSHVCSTGSRLSPFHEGCGAVSQPPCQAVF